MKRYWFAAPLLLPLIVILIWSIAIPTNVIERLLEDNLSRSLNLRVRVEDLKKDILFGLEADSLTLYRDDRTIIKIDDLKLRINPLTLITGTLDVYSIKGNLGSGKLKGNLSISSSSYKAHIEASNIDIATIPYMSGFSLKGTDSFSGNLKIKDGKGEARFWSNNVVLDNAFIAGVALPLKAFNDIKGALDLSPGYVDVKSFSFEGSELSARIKGTVKAGTMDMVMEVMPKASYLNENSIFFSLLNQYKVSPGYYAIPIKGPLS